MDLQFLNISVRVRVDERMVVSNLWMRIDSIEWRDKPVLDVLKSTLQRKAAEYFPIPDGTDIELICLKMNDSGTGRPADDVGELHDCTDFLDVPIPQVAHMVPTRSFRFDLALPKEVRPPPVNALSVIMAHRNSRRVNHLPHEKTKENMQGMDVLYNRIRQYLQAQDVGWAAEDANTL